MRVLAPSETIRGGILMTIRQEQANITQGERGAHICCSEHPFTLSTELDSDSGKWRLLHCCEGPRILGAGLFPDDCLGLIQ
jgi:hypothetical protein